MERKEKVSGASTSGFSRKGKGWKRQSVRLYTMVKARWKTRLSTRVAAMDPLTSNFQLEILDRREQKQRQVGPGGALFVGVVALTTSLPILRNKSSRSSGTILQYSARWATSITIFIHHASKRPFSRLRNFWRSVCCWAQREARLHVAHFSFSLTQRFSLTSTLLSRPLCMECHLRLDEGKWTFYSAFTEPWRLIRSLPSRAKFSHQALALSHLCNDQIIKGEAGVWKIRGTIDRIKQMLPLVFIPRIHAAISLAKFYIEWGAVMNCTQR